MTIKYLWLLFVIFCVSIAHAETPDSHSFFNSMDDFLQQKFGVSDEEDPDIKITAINDTSYLWAVDYTPSFNPTRYLLENKGDKVRVLLEARIAESIWFCVSENGRLPRRIVTKTAKYPMIRIEYLKVKKQFGEEYQMHKCEKIDVYGGKAKVVSCSKALVF